jgi:hypothetical protein
VHRPNMGTNRSAQTSVDKSLTEACFAIRNIRMQEIETDTSEKKVWTEPEWNSTVVSEITQMNGGVGGDGGGPGNSQS